MNDKMKNILVIGSINMDMVIHAPRLPELGETIIGNGFATIPGGKGANQALAAARLGGNVKIIAAVGRDIYGNALIENLKCNHIDCEGIVVTDGPTGIAAITVCNGDNQIIVDKGANEKLSADIIDENIELVKWADIVVLQMEMPQSTVLHAAKLAKQYGAKVLLNPAPMQDMMPEILDYVDILVPNQHEAQQILGMKVHTYEEQEEAVRQLLNMGINQVVITLGSKGSIYNIGTEIRRQEIFETDVVDTTAAGDSFIGGFCVALCQGNPIDEAITYATAISALTVSKAGASTSLPTKNEVDEFLKKSDAV